MGDFNVNWVDTSLIGPYDRDKIDTNDAEEKLLFLENIPITYTDGNNFKSFSTTAMET